MNLHKGNHKVLRDRITNFNNRTSHNMDQIQILVREDTHNREKHMKKGANPSRIIASIEVMNRRKLIEKFKEDIQHNKQINSNHLIIFHNHKNNRRIQVIMHRLLHPVKVLGKVYQIMIKNHKLHKVMEEEETGKR